MSIFKKINRRKTNSLKWDTKGDDIIPIWVADMDIKAPKQIIKTLKNRLKNEVLGYTVHGSGYLKSICKYQKRHYGWKIKAKWIMPGGGVVGGFNAALRVCAGHVICASPVYPPLLNAHANQNVEQTTIPMKNINGRWSIDIVDMEKAIKSDTKAFILCNPHNPCGTVFAPDELRAMADVCLKHGLTIISDEIHSDFVLKKGLKHTPIASLGDDVANITITLNAASKAYNIAGLSSSYAIVPNEDLRGKLAKAFYGTLQAPNMLGMIASEVAYTSCDEWLGKMQNGLRENRKIVQKWLDKNPRLKALKHEGTFLRWIDCKDLSVGDAEEFFMKFGVAVSGGAAFGQPDFVRINFATDKNTLKKALKRMQKAIDSV